MKKLLFTLLGFVLCGLLVFGSYKYYVYSLNKPYSYYPGCDFITDISSSDKLVKVNLIIEFGNSKHKKFMEKNNHKIKDLILFIIRNKDLETMKSNDIKQILTKDIIDALEKDFGIDTAEMIYFNEFVVE